MDRRLRWIVEKDVPGSWQGANAVLTAWKSKVKKDVTERERGKNLTIEDPLETTGHY